MVCLLQTQGCQQSVIHRRTLEFILYLKKLITLFTLLDFFLKTCDLGFTIYVGDQLSLVLGCWQSAVRGVAHSVDVLLVCFWHLPSLLYVSGPEGVACCAQTTLLRCADSSISARQTSGAGAVSQTDTRSWGSGVALSAAPWKLHSFAPGLIITGASASQIPCYHFTSLRVTLVIDMNTFYL